MFQEDLHGIWNQTAVRVPRRSAFILGGDEKAGAGLEVLALPLAFAACFRSFLPGCLSKDGNGAAHCSLSRLSTTHEIMHVSQVTTGGPK